MTETHEKSRRQSGRIRILIPIIIVALIGGAFWAWRHYSGSESTDDAQVDNHVYAVNARVGGTLIAVNVHENQVVQAGEVLIQIDDRDFRNALTKAEADLGVAEAAYREARAGLPVTSSETGGRISRSEASLVQAKAGVEATQKDFDVAQARLNLATARSGEVQAAYAKAVKDLDRMKTLIAKDEVSQQQYDAAVTAFDSARAAVEASKATIQEAQSTMASAQARVAQARSAIGIAESDVETSKAAPQEIAVTQAGIDTAAARVAQAKAAIELVRTNIEYAVVRAPVAGMVTKKNAEIGQVVQPGQALLAVVPLKEVWVTANFKETQLDNIRLGQPAEIRVDAYGGVVFKAHVDSISAATGGRFSLLPAENASGNFVKVVQRIPVKLLLDGTPDPEHVLRPGMSAVVKVLTKDVGKAE
jgi:membrane fusion protein (multidrug efflux system)